MTASFVEQTRFLYRQGNPKEALDLSERALLEPNSELSPGDRHELLILKSHSLNALGRWEEALGALDCAGLASDMDAADKARLAMHRGYLMGSLARYAECWILLHEAERAAREFGLPMVLAEVLWRRGMISIFAGEFNGADCLCSALEIASAEKNRQLQGLAIAGLAKNLMYRREYSRAVTRFEEALKIFEELGAPFYSAVVQGELGTCYLHLGETEKALSLLERTAEIFLANGSLSNYQVCLADIGGVYLRRGEFLTAISYYQKALALARQLGDQLSVAKWLRNLVQAYSHLGSPALARGFEIEADQINRGLDEERRRAARIAASHG